MLGSLSLDVSNIRDELTRHVGENWNAIVDYEVDGKDSIRALRRQKRLRCEASCRAEAAGQGCAWSQASNPPELPIAEGPGGNAVREGGREQPPAVPPKPVNRRFYLSTQLDTMRVNRDVSRLMDEVINHVMQAEGAKVTIRLEVEASLPNGAPVPTERTVTENCRTLHVESFGFEKE